MKKRRGIYHLSLPLKYLAVHVMERYELNFTMIVRIFQIHQHWTLCRRTCCCWTIASFGKSNKAEAYYTRGRHNNCDTIYIAQSNFRLPRYTIGENSNFIILFPQDAKNLTHIHAYHCAYDISLLEFKQFCHGVWSEKHNFVTIDLTSTPMNGKYRQNFNRFYFLTGTI